MAEITHLWLGHRLYDLQSPKYLLSGPLLKSLSISVLTWQDAATIRLQPVVTSVKSTYKWKPNPRGRIQCEKAQESCHENHSGASQNLPITFPFPIRQVWVWAKLGQLECSTVETGWSGQLKFLFNGRLSKKSFLHHPQGKDLSVVCKAHFPDGEVCLPNVEALRCPRMALPHWWITVPRKVKIMKLNLPNPWRLKGEIFFSFFFFSHSLSKHDPFHGKHPLFLTCPELPPLAITQIPHHQWSKS